MPIKNNPNTEVTFEIREHIGTLDSMKGDWHKEVNVVSWNEGPAKIDIRDWDRTHERMTRGITLYEEEAEALAKALANYRNSDDKFDFKSFEPTGPKGTEVTFEVLKHIRVIAERKDAWSKEVNIVSWNGGEAKFDIRDWDPTHERMSRGITLKEDQARRLTELLGKRYLVLVGLD